MDRVFHARVGAARYLALLMFTFMLVYCLWVKYILIAVLWSILLLHFIERIIHTTYTLTADGRLIVYGGRFSRSRERRLAEVVSVERRSSMQVAGRALVHYVLVIYQDSSPSTRRSSCGCWRRGSGRRLPDTVLLISLFWKTN